MADEPNETKQPTETGTTAEGSQPTPESGQESPRPHPLEPGGERWNEVYARMKEAEAREAVYRERVAALEAKVAPPPETKPQQSFYTAEQLQAYVDAGKITPMQASDQLAWQRAELKGRELAQQSQSQQKARSAQDEVRTYLDRIPALNNQASPEFTKVARAAWEIADELGLPVSDPRVQRRALRETFGTPEKLTETTRTQEFSRTHANTQTELSGGGGSMTGRSNANDPLKGVDRRYIEHWERLGYTKERMIAEAKYIKRPFPGYRDAVHGQGASKQPA